MKIWIVYADVGSGHKICAEALKEYFPEAQVHDFLEYCPVWINFLISRGYRFLVRRLPWLWALIYYSGQWGAPLALPFFRAASARIFKTLLVKALEDRPQFIISTHFITAQIAAVLKNKIPFRLINVITDFGVHRFWISAAVDKYVCASSVTAGFLKREGIVPEKIISDGVPVRKGFLEAMDREALYKKYECLPEQLKILVLSSNLSGGFLRRIIEAFQFQAKLFVITGGNRDLERAIKRSPDKTVYCAAFHGRIWELMDIADIVLTKAGGMVSIELFTKGKPAVFVQAHLGQEYFNAKVLTRILRCSTWTNSLSKVLEALKSAPLCSPQERPDPDRTIARIREYLYG